MTGAQEPVEFDQLAERMSQWAWQFYMQSCYDRPMIKLENNPDGSQTITNWDASQTQLDEAAQALMAEMINNHLASLSTATNTVNEGTTATNAVES